ASLDGKAPRLESRGHFGSLDFRFVRAAGEENEIRGAFRSILGGGRSFDEAEIAYATRESYLPLAWELASEYAIPATFSEGIAVHYTRPGKAAVELLRWIENWEDVHLRRAAQAGVLRFDVKGESGGGEGEAELESSASGGEKLESFSYTGASFARTLREAAIGWGRERHLVRLAALETERVATLEKKRLESEDEPWMSDRIERTRSAAAVVESLLALAPAEEELLSISTLASALAKIVEARAAVKSEIDGMARSAICGMLRELAAIPGEPLAKGETCDRIREALLELHVGASNPRPGHVHVAPIRAAGWSGRPMLFVVGLEEGRYPGGGTQDPILLDAERTRINAEIDPHQLPLLADRPRRVTAEFWRMLRRAEVASATLSWPSIDLRERREKFSSQVLLEAFRIARDLPDAGYEELVKAASSEGFVPSEQPLSMSEWWLGEAFATEGAKARLGEALMRAYPWLADGRRAAEARASEEITAWDGKVDAPPEELDPRHQDRLYSASRLERMAACPFGYFLQSILGIEPLETIDRSEEWLSPMEYGSVFHTVLETFMREICSRGEKPGLERHRGRLAEIATAELERMRNEIPPPSDSAFDARREDLVEACVVFLRMEEKRCGEVDAKYFEVPFGFDDPEAELSMVEPLAIELGRGRSVRLRGYIDRVDHHPGRDEWHVWDYKSGSPWKFKQPGSLAGGTMIQHAIYARAVNTMLDRRGEKGRVALSGYYFPTVKGRGEQVAKVSDPASLETTLNHLFDVVGSGWFPQGDLDRCKFCDFPSICQKTKESVEEQRVQCVANLDDSAVDAWIRLQGVK
ncbi:MAG: PD-(D/E)XK nuclease family protein, partial [Thermoanaerobaculia bacterium]